jgi:hypothetical protein
MHSRWSIVLFFFVAHYAQAAPWQCTLDALRESLPTGLDSAVELELDTSPEVLRLLTTSDGKVSGLLQSSENLPRWFLQTASSKFPQIADARQIEWDALDYKTQIRLIREVSSKRRQSFFSDRRAHGLVTRKTLTLEFEQTTVFLGKTYPPGSHTIDVSSVLAAKVEYAGPNDLNSFGGIELHFRSGQVSGQTSNDAWKLLDGLRIPRNHQHVHVLAPLNAADFGPNPEVHAALMGDFFRRANLAAEMLTVLHEGGSIAPEVYDGITFFDSVPAHNLSGVTSYFLQFGKGHAPPIGAQYKLGWVGMRGTDTYDKPGLWGLEMRSISSGTDPEAARGFLNGVQQSMNSGNYGIPREQIGRWLADVHESRIASRIANVWYGQSVNTLFQRATPPIQAKFGEGAAALAAREKILDAMTGRKEVKMVLFDWSSDPLVFENPALAEKIIAEQLRAIDRILTTPEPNVNDIISDFLVDSGLYAEVMRSLGVRAQARPR